MAELPPWNWSGLTEGELMAELEDLAVWVAELQEAHGRWVQLPACWPCHRALREELAVFWYWRLRLDKAADAVAEEAVRWHQSLRASAQAWSEAFGGCRHESLGEVDEERDEKQRLHQATRSFVDAFMGTTGA